MKWIKILLIILLSFIVLSVLLIGVLTVFEYRPKEIESIEIHQNQNQQVSIGTSYQLMTFNIGYAGLGVDEDFVLDGGKSGRPSSKEVVDGYLNQIKDILVEYPIDFYLLQEVDLKARRSYHINQVEAISQVLGSYYSSQFAYNFKALFVPFPLSLTDHIGYVESGIITYSKYEVNESYRHQFPGSFSWPLRVANLKRAMMVSYLDIQNSDKKFIIINLHMSAYDGDGSLRAQEMEMLKTWMSSLYAEGHYVVVGGDFNQTFPEANGIYPVHQDFYVAHTIENNWLPDGFTFQIDTNHPSCRLLNQPYDPNSLLTQYYIIDGFIVSNNIVIEPMINLGPLPQAHTLNLDFQASDHNPVIVKIKLT